MDFTNTIENAGSLMTESESSPSPASNPAGLQAREELAKIMSDPAHPMHAGYKRNEKPVQDHLDAIYKKAYGTAPVEIGGGESITIGGPVEPQPGETAEDAEVRARNEVILAPLKQEWGPNYDRRFAAAQVGLRTLFEGQGEMLDHLGERIRLVYGPKGEAAVLKLFAELEDIKTFK